MSTDAQKTNYLFKRSLFVGTTRDDVEFFSEPIRSDVPIATGQIWGDSGLIPPTAPVLAPDAIDGSGTVQYKEKLLLTAQPGGQAFYSPLLKNAISFNYDPAGSYNYTLYQNDGTTVITFGLGWIVDTASGILTFYSSLPPGMPPKISFYRYVGTLGVSGSGLPTDASGVTTISDGASGVNPVNKAQASTGDVLYLRKNNGLTILNSGDVPGGLSNVSPYGNIDNNANTTTLVKKISTVGAVNVIALTFPSDATNHQSYATTVTAHGTCTVGIPGEVYMKEIKGALCWPFPPVTMRIGLGTEEGGDLSITFNGTGYDVIITGIAGRSITWLLTVVYSQYRIA